jgi:hypothetical protein
LEQEGYVGTMQQQLFRMSVIDLLTHSFGVEVVQSAAFPTKKERFFYLHDPD